MNTFIRDLRHAVRTLGRSPGTVLAVVLTLGLAIGANTAIFSLVNGVLLQPLPFHEPDRLVHMVGWASTTANLENWKETADLFDRVSLIASTRNLTLVTGSGNPERIRGFHVSADFFPMLGIQPQLGRWFQPEEAQAGAEPVAIISDKLWKNHFGSTPDVAGRTLSLNGDSFTVIGVLPSNFQYMGYRNIDVWVPATTREDVGMALVRLAPGIPLETARARMEILTKAMEPQTESQRTFANEMRWPAFHMESLTEQTVGGVRTRLLVLLGVVTFVLLIGCANVANLLLAWATGKQRDSAVRLALGATRGRLVAQSLTETLLLFLLGGGLGILLAVWGLDSLLGLASSYMARLQEVQVSGMVLLYSLLVTLLAGLLFGLIPALRTTQVDIGQMLAGGTMRATSSPRHRHLRNALVIGEVALALILLTGASLLIRTFLLLQPVDPGFDPKNKLTFRVTLDDERYPTDFERRAFLTQLLSRIEALPGTESVAAINHVRMGGLVSMGRVTAVEGEPVSDTERPPMFFHWVTPNYLRTMRMPIVRGRGLAETDTRGATPIAVVNRTFAKRYLSGDLAIGKRFALNDFKEVSDYTVAGVVEDSRAFGHNLKIYAEVYVSVDQWKAPLRSIGVVIQARPGPQNLSADVRGVVRSLDPTLPVLDLQSMEDVLSQSVSYPRSQAQLMGLFAALALVLTVVGIYGVLSYTVSERTHEMGIRIALGANSGDIVKLILRGGMGPTVIGIGVGLAGSWALTRLLKYQLYGVTATDPTTFVGVALLLLLVALAACWIPARRATRVDPMVALRYE